MTARLQETILYDVIDSITAMDLPASVIPHLRLILNRANLPPWKFSRVRLSAKVWKIVNFNKSVFKTEF